MNLMKSTVSLIVIAMILSGCTAYSEKNTTSNSTMKAPFGNPDDTAYASSLWNELITSGLNTKPATLYIGGPPHGKVREVLEGTLHGKRVIVVSCTKKEFAPLTKDQLNTENIWKRIESYYSYGKARSWL